MPSTVLVVEGQSLVRDALFHPLASNGVTLRIAHGFEEAAALLGDGQARFDAAIVEHRLSHEEVALPLVRALSERTPVCSSLVVMAPGDHGVAPSYKAFGAFRCFTRTTRNPHLLSHVHATLMNTYRWRRAMKPSADAPGPPVVVVDFEAAADRLRFVAGLSPIEREVAYWLLNGLRDAQIACLLERAERTAKRHVGQVLAKAGVQNRASLWSVLGHDGALAADTVAMAPERLVGAANGSGKSTTIPPNTNGRDRAAYEDRYPAPSPPA